MTDPMLRYKLTFQDQPIEVIYNPALDLWMITLEGDLPVLAEEAVSRG